MKRVVYLQENEYSCGSMCIKSVLSYYDIFVPLETINEDVKLSDMGISLYNMINAFRKYGFDSDGLRINNRDLSKYSVPFIALLNNHFVVVYKVSNKIMVMDPAKGLVWIKKRVFLYSFRGIIVTCYKRVGITYKKPHNVLKIVFLEAIKKQKKNIFLILLLNLILSILSFIFTFYPKYNQSINLFIIFLILNLFITLLNIIIINIKTNSSIKIKEYLNGYILKHLFSLNTISIFNKKVGEVVNKINKLSFIESVLVKIIYEDTSSIFIIIFVSLFMLKISIYVFISLIIYSLIIIIFEICFYKKNRTILNNVIYFDNKHLSSLYEYINNFMTIKTFNIEKYINNKLNNTYTSFLSSFKRYTKYINYHEAIVLFINNFYLLLFNSVILYLVKIKILNINYLVILNLLINIYISSLKSICLTFKGLTEIKLYLNNIEDFLITKSDGITINEEFKSLKVVHNSKNLVDIKPNKHIFIKGPSGSGKTTLALKIAGIRSDFDNNILLNNYNIKDILNISDYIIYISSDSYIFDGTIKENILFDKNYDITNILNICLIDKILSRKNITIDTVLDGLSAGEKSRIIIARALAKKPKVLIIDELLSSLSLDEENIILNNLFNINNLTIIYISHRETNIKFDYIIDMEKEVMYENK